jgi:hypothetical protein
MIFVFMDFGLVFGHVIVGLIPAFLGYLIMLGGISEVQSLSNHFAKVKPFVKTMVYLAGVAYVLDLFGGLVGSVLDLEDVAAFLRITYRSALMFCSLIIAYRVLMGIKDIEIKTEKKLDADKLYSTWNRLAIVCLFTCLLAFAAELAVVSMAIYFVFSIIYLVSFNRARTLYYE